MNIFHINVIIVWIFLFISTPFNPKVLQRKQKKNRSQTTTRSEKIHSVRFHTYSYRFPYLQTHERNVFEWKVNVVVQQHHTQHTDI